MADKKLNEVTTVNSGTLANVKNFLAVMNDGSIQQMSKADLASVVGGLIGTVSENKNGLMSKDNFFYRGTIVLKQGETFIDYLYLLKTGTYAITGYSDTDPLTDWSECIKIAYVIILIPRNYKKVVIFTKISSGWRYSEITPTNYTNV